MSGRHGEQVSFLETACVHTLVSAWSCEMSLFTQASVFSWVKKGGSAVVHAGHLGQMAV